MTLFLKGEEQLVYKCHGIHFSYLFQECGLEMTFCTDFEVLGKITEVELKTGGKDVQVTEENKEEYIE